MVFPIIERITYNMFERNTGEKNRFYGEKRRPLGGFECGQLQRKYKSYDNA